jgi:hypothetical protein
MCIICECVLKKLWFKKKKKNCVFKSLKLQIQMDPKMPSHVYTQTRVLTLQEPA